MKKERKGKAGLTTACCATHVRGKETFERQRQDAAGLRSVNIKVRPRAGIKEGSVLREETAPTS